MFYVCCGMIRSGSTWQFQIVSHLITHFLNGIACGYIEKPEELNDYMEKTLLENKELVVKSHAITERISKETEKGNVKLIYIYRDIRDVACSIIAKSNHNFSDLFKNEIIDDAIKQFYSIKSITSKNVLIQKYEEVFSNPGKAVGEIADFLNVELTNSKFQELVEEYSLKKQKERISVFYKSLPVVYQFMIKFLTIFSANRFVVHLHKAYDKFTYYDSISLLHYNHIKDGKVGKWRVLLNEKEKIKINRWASNWLSDAGYDI